MNARAGQPPPAQHWYHTAMAILFAAFCLEIGLFLVVFPWSNLWHRNWLSQLAPHWYEMWISPWFRGAVSGLGLVDVYIALLEVVRLSRISLR
jgi:hypothetical protein